MMIRFKHLPKNIHEKIDSLSGLLMKDANIIFAYLFGGLSRGGSNPLSDIDLALYVKRIKALDYLKLFGEISKTLGTDEIDLVILNNAPLSLTGRILQTRKILTDKNPLIRHKYESMTLRKFSDFKVKEKNILQGRYGIG
jgi:predicted nucleotidyltransferase